MKTAQKYDAARSSLLLKNMPDHVVDMLLKSAVTREYGRGETIFLQGDTAKVVHIALEGWVKLYRIAPNGNEAVVSVFTQQAGRICTLATVADALHTSPRTLNRKLKAEGTGFQRMLDSWLSQQAINYLVDGGLTVEATASLMGYGDEANFRRAFRRWHGCSPRAYRETRHANRAER